MVAQTKQRTNIEILLGDWGGWRVGENRGGLGYPSRSAFQAMRVDGQRHADPDVPMVDDDMRRLDALINAMHPDYKAVLTLQYISPGLVKTKAGRLRVSIRSYYTTLEHAHRMLAHSMGGRYMMGWQTKVCAHLDLTCAQM